MIRYISRDLIESGRYWTEGITAVEGCTPIAPECLNCWAKGMHERFHPSTSFLTVVARPRRMLEAVGRGGQPQVYSIWNDFFHESIPISAISKLLRRIINARNESIWLICTKRQHRANQILRETIQTNELVRAKNLWIGATFGTQERMDQGINDLIWTPAQHKYISIEPILSYITLPKEVTAKTIDWIIVGCESGSHARINKDTYNQILSVKVQAQERGIPVFIKSYPVFLPQSEKWVSRLHWSDLPPTVDYQALKVREFPVLAL